ncbi:MAG: glucose-6-phosphate dehydrogenase assembly protein OpcA [Thermomicrobiales bacterium]
MAETRSATRTESEHLSTRWEANSIEVPGLHAELDALWRQWAIRHGATDGDVATARDHVYMRPSTVNVIAVTETAEQAFATADLLVSLPDYSPSRSIVLARAAVPHELPFTVDMIIDERVLHRSSSPTRIEVITLTAPQGHDEVLASIASTLLVPDLPDVLYVPREPFAENPLILELSNRTDGLLVDTATAQDIGATFEFLRVAKTHRNSLGLGDLVWTRLRTWRDLIAQFYDQPSSLASLDHITEVEIVYAPSAADKRSGLTAALLIAGWLASRLGWRIPGELIPHASGYRLTLRAGGKGRSREVLLHIAEGKSEFSCSSLERVTMVAGGPHPSTFRVERTGESAITTYSSAPNVADMTRLVHSSCPPDQVILAAKLRRLRIDQVYAEALELAASLWPEGFEP